VKSAMPLHPLPLNTAPSKAIPMVGLTYPPTTYAPFPSIVNEVAPLRGSCVNTVDFVHSVGPSSVLESLSSSLLQELNDVSAIVQAKNNNSQFFLFINYLNFVYNIFNFILGFEFSDAIVAVLKLVNKLELVVL